MLVAARIQFVFMLAKAFNDAGVSAFNVFTMIFIVLSAKLLQLWIQFDVFVLQRKIKVPGSQGSHPYYYCLKKHTIRRQRVRIRWAIVYDDRLFKPDSEHVVVSLEKALYGNSNKFVYPSRGIKINCTKSIGTSEES